MDKRNIESITAFFKHYMRELKTCCEAFPTCDGCPWRQKHKGCYFKQGKSPREWK